MIPADLSTITWKDIEALITAAREEDDTIEYKASFKDGEDYTILSDAAKERSLDAIAREAIAFLNTRGGDVVIGVAEKRGDHPRAEAIVPIKRPQDTADRLARGLAQLIEPAQTNLAVRGLSDPRDINVGVVIVRARASVRAPHRSKRSREAYARRGSESVPMAMDEIQDLTMYRSRIRQERQELLDRQFVDFCGDRCPPYTFHSGFVHIRSVYFPATEQELGIDQDVLTDLSTKSPRYFDGAGVPFSNNVAFGDLTVGSWRPILRGRKAQHYESHADPPTGKRVHCSAITVKESGIVALDFAISHRKGQSGEFGLHNSWAVGYLAKVSDCIVRLTNVHPLLLPGTLRMGINVSREHQLIMGQSHFLESYKLAEQREFLPDFEITSAADTNAFFQQAQIDLLALAGKLIAQPYSLTPPLVSHHHSQ